MTRVPLGFAAAIVMTLALLFSSLPIFPPLNATTGRHLIEQTRPTTDPARGAGLLVGQVVDGSTGEPIAGAIVAIFGDSTDWSVMIANANGQTIVSATAKGVPEPAPPRQLITDALGRWAFRELTKGRYTVHALAPGYLTGGYGQPSASADGPLPTLPNEQPIELESDDARIGGLMIRLWKPGVITGTVTDEAGEPVVGLAVRAWRHTTVNGRLDLDTVPGLNQAGVLTDDRGVYRIADLPPGRYVVGVLSAPTAVPADTVEMYFNDLSSEGRSVLSAQLARSSAPAVMTGGYRVDESILQTFAGGRDGGTLVAENGKVLTYPSVFHPTASIPSQATVIAVASGQEHSNIDLRLALVPAVRVSGVVMGPSGLAPHLGVQICLPDSTESTRTPTTDIVASSASDALGRFTFLGVTPGQYVIKALRVPAWPRPDGPGDFEAPAEPALWSVTRISVGTTDLREVAVTLATGIIVKGRLEFDGDREKPSATELQRFTIQIANGEPGAPALFPAVRIGPDGLFSSLGYPPGRYAIRAEGRPPWKLRSATVRGRSVLDTGLEVGTEEISDLVVTFTDRTSEIAGRIRAADGTLDTATTVVVFPADAESWRDGFFSTYRARMLRTSSAATYSLTALPPGEYFIAALRAETVGEWKDPRFLGAVARVATRVTIANGEKKTVDLVTRIPR